MCVYGLGWCQVNSAMYLLIVSSVCMSVYCRRAGQGTRQGVVSLPAAPVTWNKSSVVERSCDSVCVCFSVFLCMCVCVFHPCHVIWAQLRAGSEKCWVALRGSFHPGNRQTSEHAGRERRWTARWMDGCQTEVWESQTGRKQKRERDREGYRKSYVTLSHHGKAAQPILSFSSLSLCGFLYSRQVKIQAYNMSHMDFSVTRQVCTFFLLVFMCLLGCRRGKVCLSGWLCCILLSLETATDSPWTKATFVIESNYLSSW